MVGSDCMHFDYGFLCIISIVQYSLLSCHIDQDLNLIYTNLLYLALLREAFSGTNLPRLWRCIEVSLKGDSVVVSFALSSYS
jgi:hypothetical protein